MDQETITKLLKFFKEYRLIQYRKNEIVFRPGDKIDSVYFTKEGYLRLYTINRAGKEVTFNFFKPAFYLSLFYCQTGLPNKYYMETVTPCEIWQAPCKDFVDFIKKNDKVSEGVHNGFWSLFDEILTGYEMAVSGDSMCKIASILTSLSKKYGNDIKTTHEIIASLAGVTRETVGIQLAKMEKEGLITREGRKITVNKLH